MISRKENVSYKYKMPCSVGRNTKKYGGTVVASTLQDVTENGNTTTLSIQTDGFFIGDGSLLTNIPGTFGYGNLEQVTTTGNATSHEVTFENTFTSLEALGNVVVAGNVTALRFHGDGANLTGIVTLTDFDDNVSRIVNLESNLIANSERTTDLETYLGSNVSRIINLESNLIANSERIGSLETEVQPVNRGGTGLTSFNVGDLLYASDTTTLNKLSIGSVGEGNVLTTTSSSSFEWRPPTDIVEVDTLQSVTSRGSKTTQQVTFENPNTSMNALGNVVVLGNVTALTFYGDGTNLTDIPKVSDFNDNVSRIVNLESNLIANSDRIDDLRTDLGSNVSKIVNLESNLIANSERIDDLRTDLGSNVSRIDNLETEIQPIDRGGTGLTTYTQGDILYAVGNDILTKLQVGSTGEILKSSGLVPYWTEADFTVTNNFTYINVITSWVQRGEDIDGTLQNLSGASVAISDDGTILAIGHVGTGIVKIYIWDGSTWNIRGNISGSSADKSGTSISLSSDGNKLAIGSIGYVRVYQWSSGTTWNKVGNDLTGGNLRFGFSVDVSSDGNTIVIGEPGNDYDIDGLSNDIGKVRVFNWSGSAWSQVGSDIVGEQGDFTGFSVSITSDGSIIAFGEPRNNTEYRGGRVRIFENDNGSWIQQGGDITGTTSGDQVGYAVDLSGDGTTLALGTPFNDENGIQSGIVKMYRWNTENWVQKGVDINGILAGDWFGNSVSLSNDGNTVIAGSILSDEKYVDAGQIRVFRWSGTVWEQVGYSINGEFAGDNSGTSVAISADGLIIAIGAPYNTNNAGHVRVYTNEVISSETNYDNQFIEVNAELEKLRVANLNTNTRVDVLDIRLSSLETSNIEIYNRLSSNVDRIESLELSNNDVNTRLTSLENTDIIQYGRGIVSGFNKGDIIVATSTNVLGVLPMGTSGQFLKTDGLTLYWGEETVSDDQGSGDLQSVTEIGNETDVSVRFTNTGTSIYASGTIEASVFLGDGGLLSNTSVTPDFQEVTDNGNVTSNSVQFTNTGTSIKASGKIIASSFEGSGLGITGVAMETDLNDNSSRISNLETSNNAIWYNIPRISNLETSNNAIWSSSIISGTSGITGFNQGDMLYATGTNTLGTLTIGDENFILQIINGVPTWTSLTLSLSDQNITQIGSNTGISNTNPEYTLHVGSNVVIDDIGSDVVYVSGNVYATNDIQAQNAVRGTEVHMQKLFVKNTEVVAERPPRKVRI